MELKEERSALGCRNRSRPKMVCALAKRGVRGRRRRAIAHRKLSPTQQTGQFYSTKLQSVPAPWQRSKIVGAPSLGDGTAVMEARPLRHPIFRGPHPGIENAL